MGATTSTSASFTFTSTEAGTFQCKLDAAASAPCSSPKAYSGLSVGSHTFTVRAIDAAGNTDASPATQTWTVSAAADTTAPNTTITASPANPTTSTSASFSFTSTESASTFQCKLDAAAYAVCTSAKSYTGSSLGSHTFSVRATDAAGNMDASAATDTWMISSTVDHIPGRRVRLQPDGAGHRLGSDVRRLERDVYRCALHLHLDRRRQRWRRRRQLGSGQRQGLTFTFTGAGVKNIRLRVKDADGDTTAP